MGLSTNYFTLISTNLLSSVKDKSTLIVTHLKYFSIGMKFANLTAATYLCHQSVNCFLRLNVFIDALL